MCAPIDFRRTAAERLPPILVAAPTAYEEAEREERAPSDRGDEPDEPDVRVDFDVLFPFQVVRRIGKSSSVSVSSDVVLFSTNPFVANFATTKGSPGLAAAIAATSPSPAATTTTTMGSSALLRRNIGWPLCKPTVNVSAT
eukprot:CAMPEP_0117503926 /NCGR_PEP_ID=MMETSP0784-20121206/24584_1 /TAXON_ID=39447 /ORGANISM="" /LENGTH=140 /DNA_ID=CAMNT_0005299263 /DNA_START=182 /DNA_END=601 /DNA_ORIENTATION=-